jgi:hypothetical protein
MLRFLCTRHRWIRVLTPKRLVTAFLRALDPSEVVPLVVGIRLAAG